MPRVALLFALPLIASLVWHPNARVYSQLDSEVEAYAFYSALYRDSKTLEPGELLGIAAQSRQIDLGLHCVVPVTAEDREMVKAANGASPIEWKQKFQFGRAYLLIAQAEVDRAIDCIGGVSHDQSSCEPYKGMRYVRILSTPGFNRDQTRALVSISRVCGGLCGNGSTSVYRKTVSGWEQEKRALLSAFGSHEYSMFG